MTAPTGKLAATALPVLVMAIAVFMILNQLRIATDIVTITYAALLGAVALGMALAFGLGGRDVASRMLEDAYAVAEQGAGRVRQALPALARDADGGAARPAKAGRLGRRPTRSRRTEAMGNHMAKNVGETLRDSANEVVQQAARSVTTTTGAAARAGPGMRGMA